MKLDELDKEVTQADIEQLEKFADKIFSKVGIDVNFTRHFLDRVNDERNGKPISMSELTRLFKQEQKRWGKKIAQLGPDEEGVMKDLQTDINLPFALRWDSKNDELDLIAKTVMRKSNFRTPNPEFPVENINEDFGSVPPLAELILMAVVAKTTVDVIIGSFKAALKTGKGLKKLNDLRKRVAKMGQNVADYALPEATKDELLSKLDAEYRKGHMAHAVHAMRALAQSKGDRHGLGYYAATIARAFNAIDRKELEAAYREQFSEGIIHEDTLTELNILRKKNDGVKQSNPLVVLDKLSQRRDEKPFPIKFYDGETIEVTPKMARRFMNKYYDDLEPEQRDIVDRYITTKNGFTQAVKKLQIAEGWSEKYKKSIDCNNPKGFSQKAHCDGKKKK